MAQITVDHKDQCGADIAKLFGSDYLSDVTLVISGKRFPAHKTILIIRSDYFRKLFSSGLSESTQQEITIDEPCVNAFVKLLRYIYTGELTLPISKEGELLELLRLANKYLFTTLETSIFDRLKKMITAQNFFPVYAVSWLCSASLKTECFKFMDLHAEEILSKDDGFASLTLDAAVELVDHSILKQLHVRLCQVVFKWVESNGRERANSLLSQISLAKLPTAFMLGPVRCSGLFSETAMLDAITEIQEVFVNKDKSGDENACVHVYYVLPSGKVVTIQSRLMNKVASVERTIAKREGISVDDLDLYYQGKLLNGSPKLRDYNIKNGSVLHVSIECDSDSQ